MLRLWYSNRGEFRWIVEEGGAQTRLKEVNILAPCKTNTDLKSEPRAWVEFDAAVLAVEDDVGTIRVPSSTGRALGS